MLSKKSRLSRPDFLLTRRLGKQISTSYFSAVFFCPITHNSQPITRFSIVLSSKFHKSAVIRNHLRRKIYGFLSTSHLALSTNVILYPNSSVLNLSDDQLAAETDNLLSKIHS